MVLLVQESQGHFPGVNGEEHQQVHCPMPLIVELLLLDRTGDRSADRVTSQDLEVGDLIDTYHPDPLSGQAIRIPIAPKDLLCSSFEPGVQAGGLPIARAMRLQIDVM